MFSGLTGIDIAYIFIALLIAMVVHEMMHGYVAYWLGDRTAADMGRLTLNPLASIDPFTTVLLPLLLIVTIGVPFFAAKPVPFNPARVKWDEYGAALVGLAGPATNLVLALIGAALFHISSGGASTFLYFFVVVNIGVMVFNLIPFPPLDGSRVLYAFAPEPVQEIMARIEAMGFVVILIFVLVLFQFIAPAIGSIDSHIIHALTGV